MLLQTKWQAIIEKAKKIDVEAYLEIGEKTTLEEIALLEKEHESICNVFVFHRVSYSKKGGVR